MEVCEGDLMSDKAFFCPFRDAILKPRNNRMTPRGDPAAKKFFTGNKRGANFLLSVSSISWFGKNVGNVSGCSVKTSNASIDYAIISKK